MRRLTIVMALLALMSMGFAEQSFTYEVVDANSALRANNSELPKLMNPGEPMLPYHPVKILLPMGMEIENFEIQFSRVSNEIKTDIKQANFQIPISSTKNIGNAVKSNIYNKNTKFPQNQIVYLGTQYKNGLAIAHFNVFPYQFNPVKKILSWNNQFTINLEYNENSDVLANENAFLLSNNSREEKLFNVEHSNLDTYRKINTRPESRIPEEGDPYQFIIVTNEEFEAEFTDFIQRKETSGIHTGLVKMEDIIAEYDGVDNAEKLRNYIIDAYQTYSSTSTPLEYVLLGGDDEVVPYRGCYGEVGSYTDNGIPTDYYFSNLDGDWNDNGNGIYGEHDDDVDLYPEIAVGRIPADASIDFQRFFAKNLYYAESSSYSNKIAYMFGENLNNNPLTWGGDYTDEIEPYIPDEFAIEKRYERDDTFSPQKIIDAFNDGFAIVNHMGHANEHFVFGLTNSSMVNLNNREVGFAYSQGCYPAAFDEGTSESSESVAEQLVITEGGLYAFVGNTRYGWYAPGSTNGASQYFAREYFKALYEQDIREHGDALVYSKEQLINEVMSSTVMRWVYYELILFGDPTMTVKDPDGEYCKLELVDHDFNDSSGDNDGVVNPGESGELAITIKNGDEWDDCISASATLTTENPNITISDNTIDLGAISSGQTISGTEVFAFEIASDAPIEPFIFKISIHGETAGTTFDRDFEVSFITSLNQNTWPWSVNDKIFNSSPLAKYNVEDDYREIFNLDQDGNLYKFASHAGNLNLIQEAETVTSKSHFSMGYVNDDNVIDFAYNTIDGKIIVKDVNGEVIFVKSNLSSQRITPIMANVAGDDRLEIITIGTDRQLHVYDALGEDISGFPVELDAFVLPEIGAADLDNDGYFEIIAPLFNGELKMIDDNGSIDSGFDFSINSSFVTAPVIDGNKNIYIGADNNKIYQISSAGNKNWEYHLTNKPSNELALEEIDGEFFICATTLNGDIYYFKENGELELGYPVSIPVTLTYGPMLADLDNNGETEIVTISTSSNVYIFTKNGNQVGYSPVIQNLNGYTGATIAVMDTDGDYEIISTHYHGIAAVDVKSQKGSDIPWIMYRGNYMRNGFYGDNPVAPTDDDIIQAKDVILSQNYPNPYIANKHRAGTTIEFAIPKSQNVTVQVYNMKGQRVKTLVDNGKFDEGRHSLNWDGSNSNNQKVGAGVYFYKLQTSSKTISKKMLFIK